MEYEIKLPDVFYEFKSKPFMRHAVVAGGALRDAVYGLPASDLDIFVPCQSVRTFQDNVWESLGSVEGLEILDRKGSRDYLNKPDLDFVKYDIKYKDFDIDLMGVRMNVDGFVNNLIEGFPYGNQQIAHDGKKITASYAFDYDQEHGTMTLKNCDNVEQLVTLYDKYKKVQDKFVKARRGGLLFQTDYILAKRTGDDWL